MEGQRDTGRATLYSRQQESQVNGVPSQYHQTEDYMKESGEKGEEKMSLILVVLLEQDNKEHRQEADNQLEG